ncbi:aminoacyl tRNA synthase complex-interacting multifunctional protein 1-like isoform X2 [Macrosteles quadrilineatus]|nr:aminoacyl tRNA synthase complex-interacting multifunctional protein 1-like isoform X2 [Macrosteles quadrilineatus]
MEKFIDGCTNNMHNMHYYKGPEDDLDMDIKLVINDVAKHYPEDALIDKMVVMLCNCFVTEIDQFKNRGKFLCAVSGDKVELLLPPPGGSEGDEVIVDGFPRDPDEPFMMPHEHAFELVSPDFKVDSSGQAVYKDIPLKVEGKGIIKAETLYDCPIKFL